jgi:Protein of unknown function (DUF3800)
VAIPGADSTWIYYVDESHDNEKFALVALGLRAGAWRDAFELIKAHRSQLRESDGVRTDAEIHARDLVAGRGTLGRNRNGERLEIGKRRRAQIYSDLLGLIATLPSMHIINICLDVKGRKDPELDAWDRLLNRMNRTATQRNKLEKLTRTELLQSALPHLDAKDFTALKKRLTPYAAQVLLIADEGRQQEIARLRRKMAVINYVPSRYGAWQGGAKAKNIPLSHFVEDALFRDSERSLFIQLADCAAFALLKRESTPTPNIKKQGIEKLWDLHLRPVRLKQAASGDPDGIVRR